MLKAHKFHVKFTVYTIMSEGGDVTMEEDYTLSYRTEEWERNRAKKEGGWISVKESPPTTDGLYFTKGGLRKYNIMYFRDGKFFTHRHSDTYDSGIEFYKPVEN